MKKIKKLLKPYYLFAFFIPFFILFLTYFINGIYWKSDTSPLLGDGFHQYVIFDVTLRNILHGTDSIFYTFTSGLGLNFYALSSYYLGSFLSPLVYFFNLKNMPDAVYLFTLIKFGLMGLTCFISIKNIFKKICPYYILILSTSYA
ncbi:YfhO family protein, partial [Streptococcus milleri]